MCRVARWCDRAAVKRSVVCAVPVAISIHEVRHRCGQIAIPRATIAHVGHEARWLRARQRCHICIASAVAIRVRVPRAAVTGLIAVTVAVIVRALRRAQLCCARIDVGVRGAAVAVHVRIALGLARAAHLRRRFHPVPVAVGVPVVRHEDRGAHARLHHHHARLARGVARKVRRRPRHHRLAHRERRRDTDERRPARQQRAHGHHCLPAAVQRVHIRIRHLRHRGALRALRRHIAHLSAARHPVQRRRRAVGRQQAPAAQQHRAQRRPQRRAHAVGACDRGVERDDRRGIALLLRWSPEAQAHQLPPTDARRCATERAAHPARTASRRGSCVLQEHLALELAPVCANDHQRIQRRRHRQAGGVVRDVELHTHHVLVHLVQHQVERHVRVRPGTRIGGNPREHRLHAVRVPVAVGVRLRLAASARSRIQLVTILRARITGKRHVAVGTVA